MHVCEFIFALFRFFCYIVSNIFIFLHVSTFSGKIFVLSEKILCDLQDHRNQLYFPMYLNMKSFPLINQLYFFCFIPLDFYIAKGLKIIFLYFLFLLLIFSSFFCPLFICLFVCLFVFFSFFCPLFLSTSRILNFFFFNFLTRN